MLVQLGLCQTWSEFPKTGFLVSSYTILGVISTRRLINPYLTNEFSHRYQLGESTSFLGVLGRCHFYFLSHFSMKFLCAKRIAPDGTPHSAASHLEILFAKRDARLNELKFKLEMANDLVRIIRISHK